MMIIRGIVFASIALFVWRAEAQLDGLGPSLSHTDEIRLYSAPDESSPPAESLKRGEVLSPMAETLGAGGAKWYLVKSKTGAVGWLKARESEQAKKAESYFNSLPQEPSLSLPVEIPSASSASAQRNTIIVSVRVTGSAVIVPVTLNRTVQTHMVLDTGATFTVVSRRIAANLNLQAGSYASLLTANGMIAAPLAQLGSVRVGEAEATNLTVAIHDFSPSPQLGGLLGLDFLSRFHLSIDSRRQLLTLAPR